MTSEFIKRLKATEKKLGYTLPRDYVSFIEQHEGLDGGLWNWFYLDELCLAFEYDIVNFVIIEQSPDLLNQDDCQYLLPVLRDNDSYLVIDLRPENNKGAFIIWSDENELGFQSSDFKELIEKLKSTITEDNQDYNYFE